MGKLHLTWLTDDEIKALANMCRVTLKMAEDGSAYFEGLAKEAESALAKMKEKMDGN